MISVYSQSQTPRPPKRGKAKARSVIEDEEDYEDIEQESGYSEDTVEEIVDERVLHLHKKVRPYVASQSDSGSAFATSETDIATINVSVLPALREMR